MFLFFRKTLDIFVKVYYYNSTVVHFRGDEMEFKIDKSLPICPQICDQISACIATGEFPPDAKLLSVREVAVKAGVNPNTVQKSFEQLESKGLIYSIRGSGWFVGNNAYRAQEQVDTLAEAKTKAYFSAMAQLGFNEEQVKIYIKEWNK